MSNTNALNMIILMSVINQLENAPKIVKDSRTFSLKSSNIIHTDKRVSVSKVVPKVIGLPRRFGNLSGNSRTNKRI